MSNCPENVKRKINSIIEEMSDKHWLFSSNPGHDFMPALGKPFATPCAGRHGSTATEMIRFLNMNADGSFTISFHSIESDTAKLYLFDNSLLLSHRLHTSSMITASLRLTAVMSFMPQTK